MEYVLLGRTGVRVSPLCLGTMNFGLRTPPQEARRLLAEARSAGINFIDTADVYGAADRDNATGIGESERIIGDCLAETGGRDRIILATKAYFPTDPADPNARGAGRRHLIAACEASLRRLATDYIDLYQLHWPSAEVPLDETLRALDDLIRSGKIRYIGTSNFAPWQIVQSLWISRELGLHRVVSEQAPFSLVLRFSERYLMPMARENGIALLAWSPLWGGFLAGTYPAPGRIPEGSRFSVEYPLWTIWRRAVQPAAWGLLDLLRTLARARGCTVSQLAIGWILQHPGITSVVIGPRTPDQLRDNLGALEVRLGADDREAIDRLAPAGGLLVQPTAA